MSSVYLVQHCDPDAWGAAEMLVQIVCLLLAKSIHAIPGSANLFVAIINTHTTHKQQN